MERDPPKKKKKYVPLNGGKSTKEEQRENSTFIQSERSENKALERSRFDYSFQEIINHLLARLLPDSNFTIKLSQKLIFGEQKALDAFVAKLDNNIKYTTGVIIQLKKGKSKDDVDYKLTQEFKAKTFNYKLIQMSVRDFFDGTKYQREYLTFLNQFKDSQKNRLYVRLNKFYVNEFLVAIEEQGATPETEQTEQKPRRGNRTRFKTIAESIEVSKDVINIPDVMKFFSRSEKVDRSDIQIQDKKNSSGDTVAYIISLKCFEQETENKLPGFRYYFKHENFVMLPPKESKHKEELCEEYGQIDQKYIKIRVIKGYKSSKWDDKNLIYKIRMNQINKKKTNYTNDYFEAFHLVGILPIVKEYIEELQNRINEVPLDDLKQELFIQFEDQIKDYIRNSTQVQKYIEKFILEHMKKHFSEICEVESVKFPIRGVKLNLNIKRSQEQNFKDSEKIISQVMPKHIAQQKITLDFSIDKQFLKKLEEINVLLVSHQQKQFTFISKTEDVVETNNRIQKMLREFEILGEHQLDVVGVIKKAKYMEIINNLKQKSQQYKRIFIPQPIAEDKTKFKIMFYGPRKKNDVFFEEVKQTIEKMENQLGQYCEMIDDREASIILQDQKFQKEIEQRFKITLMLGQLQLQARLQVGRSQITIIKDKTFQRIPLGYWIYLDSKKRLSQFKQKYLQKFKAIANRHQKMQLLQYQENTRNYRLLFKQNFSLDEMLKDSLNQQRQAIENPIYIALFMPKDNKTKWMQSFLKLLITNAQFSAQRFNIYIIQQNKDQNMLKVVDIPQFTGLISQSIQLEIQWFCQKRPYNKSANTKINDAVANHLPEVILSKQDISAEKITHICDLSTNTISFWNQKQQYMSTHLIPLKFQSNGISFQYEGYVLRFPQSEYNKVLYNRLAKQPRFFLKMPFYKINLVDMQQINLFTKYKRKINKVQTQIALKNEFDRVKAFYHEKKSQLIYTFKEEDQKNLNSAAIQISSYLKQLWIQEQIPIKDVPDEKFKKLLRQRIEAIAQQSGFKYKLDPTLKKIAIQSLSQKDIQKFKKLIEDQSNYLINLSKRSFVQITEEIEYPAYWQPQTDDIQAFDVAKNTKQFLEIQALFTSRPIYSLKRIQNKIIYKNYKDEVKHLAHMNGATPKQMRLFHGTGKTPPEIIWTDKEDGFNINYSGDYNLLGRGIYFAERSQYSHSYASKNDLFGVEIRGMFLCLVLVGDSQQMKMSSVNSDVRGTNLKPNGLRYETMKGKHQICDIYVVYKNRRAYPLYFIQYQFP